jgi:hypothetical protein
LFPRLGNLDRLRAALLASEQDSVAHNATILANES